MSRDEDRKPVGWICSRCRASLAPWMPFCTNCGDDDGGGRVPRPTKKPDGSLSSGKVIPHDVVATSGGSAYDVGGRP